MSNPYESVELSNKAANQIRRNNYSAGKLHEIIDSMPNCREKSLALTKLEEVVMWANKCAARNM